MGLEIHNQDPETFRKKAIQSLVVAADRRPPSKRLRSKTSPSWWLWEFKSVDWISTTLCMSYEKGLPLKYKCCCTLEIFEVQGDIVLLEEALLLKPNVLISIPELKVCNDVRNNCMFSFVIHICLRLQ